jgi:hypothetical protein
VRHQVFELVVENRDRVARRELLGHRV